MCCRVRLLSLHNRELIDHKILAERAEVTNPHLKPHDLSGHKIEEQNPRILSSVDIRPFRVFANVLAEVFLDERSFRIVCDELCEKKVITAETRNRHIGNPACKYLTPYWAHAFLLYFFTFTIRGCMLDGISRCPCMV